MERLSLDQTKYAISKINRQQECLEEIKKIGPARLRRTGLFCFKYNLHGHFGNMQ